MDYGICMLPVAQVRSMPDERSELVTQLLFGELCIILTKKGSWIHIETSDCNYQGWMSAGQLRLLDYGSYSALIKSPKFITTDLVQIIENTSANSRMLISGGSTLYNVIENKFELLGEIYQYHGTVIRFGEFERSRLAGNSLIFVNVPYLWGGRSAFGIDCSGLMQVIFKMSGLSISRDAYQQALQGQLVDFLSEAIPGDLVFFDNDKGLITHVGLLINNSSVIHAHNFVRIDLIDQNGIFDQTLKKYTHSLRLIKRFQSPPPA